MQMTVTIYDELISQVEKIVDHRMDRRIQCFCIPMLMVFKGAGFYELSPFGWIHLYASVEVVHLLTGEASNSLSMGNRFSSLSVDIRSDLLELFKNPSSTIRSACIRR